MKQSTQGGLNILKYILLILTLKYTITDSWAKHMCPNQMIVDWTLQSEVDQASALTGLQPELILAVGWVETRHRQDQISSVGAVGIMQIYGYDGHLDLNNRAHNIRVGAEKLAWFIQTYGYERGIAGYNCGVSKKCLSVPKVRYYVGEVRRLQRLFKCM